MNHSHIGPKPIIFAVLMALALAGAALALLFSPVQAKENSAPAKPTGLTATASYDSVTLTWDDPQDDSITGYVILRRNRDTDALGQFTELVNDTGSAATAYTDGSVAAGTPLHLPHQGHQRARDERAFAVVRYRHPISSRTRQAHGADGDGVARPGGPDLGRSQRRQHYRLRHPAARPRYRRRGPVH